MTWLLSTLRVVMLAGLILAAACSAPAAPRASVPGSVRVDRETPSALPTIASFQRVGGRELGVTFEVPAGWMAEPGTAVYRPVAGSPVAVGVTRLTAAMSGEPTANLPKEARILAQEAVDLTWAHGTRYTVSLAPTGAPAREASQQVHVIVTLGSTGGYDIFATAPAADMSAQQAAASAFERLLASIVLIGG